MLASKASKWFRASAICLACLSLPAFGAFKLYEDLSWGYFNDRPFNRQQWKDKTPWAQDPLSKEFPALLRGQMAADLISNHLRRGMTRAEVQDLLGSPDADKKGNSEWEYAVGNYSGFRMDGDYLTINFDPQGRVTDYFLWQS